MKKGILKRKVTSFFRKTLLYLFLSFLIFLRRPDSITNPQFWAEDGTMWYADAYNKGFVSLLKTQAGYFQTYSRLTALFAQLFPVAKGPLIFNLSAIAAQTLPIYLVSTQRFRKIVPSYTLRLLMILLYLLLPNVGEIYINVTNAMWYLTLALFIIVVTRPEDPKAYPLDYLFILLVGVSGPFSILLSALFIGFEFFFHQKKLSQHILLLFITALIQVSGLFLSRVGGRTFFPTGISLTLLDQIIVKQVIWGALAGRIGQEAVIKYLSVLAWPFFQLTTLLAVFLIATAFFKGNKVLKQFIVFAVLIFLSSLFVPTAQTPMNGITNWELFSQAYEVRYWLIPMVMFLVSTLWAIESKNHLLVRAAGFFFLTIFFLFCVKNYRVYHNFRYGPYDDFKYVEYSKKFDSLTSGENIVIPINPKGWKMTLIKK